MKCQQNLDSTPNTPFQRNCSDLWGSTGHSASCRGAAKHGICFASRSRPLKREQLHSPLPLDNRSSVEEDGLSVQRRFVLEGGGIGNRCPHPAPVAGSAQHRRQRPGRNVVTYVDVAGECSKGGEFKGQMLQSANRVHRPRRVPGAARKHTIGAAEICATSRG